MTRPKYVLLVEDDPDDEVLTLRALRRCNPSFDVVVVHDGQEALDYLFACGAFEGRDLADRPQVVLLDLNLPKIDGHEVLRRIRADGRTRLQPVVILSSSAQDRDLVESYAGGANSYVRKPVDFADFAETARDLGRYWMSVNLLAPYEG